MQKTTIFTTPVVQPLIKGLSKLILKLLGWKVEGSMPLEARRCVLIAAPHTTNWDMPFSLMIAFALDTPLYWVGKDSIFKFPFGGVMRWLGGIPVDRSRSTNMVTATVEQLQQHDELRIMMSPEGTRSKVKQWKSGFYYIAVGADVPIVLGFIDYKQRRGGILTTFTPSGDYETDLKQIQQCYMDRLGTY